MPYKKQVTHTLYGSALLVVMLIGRICFTGQLTYAFLLWNLFLAFLPLGIAMLSYRYAWQSWRLAMASLLWLLFFPNAPYLITDIYHLSNLTGAPGWFDALMLFSAATTGLAMAFISLQLMEKQWQCIWRQKYLSTQSTASRLRYRLAAIVLLFFLTAFGIYLGRILRYNSWDLFTDTHDLAHDIVIRFKDPFVHINTWGFTMLYATVLFVLYQAWCGNLRQKGIGQE